VPGRTVLDASFHRNSGPARNLRPGKRTSRIDVKRPFQIATADVAGLADLRVLAPWSSFLTIARVHLSGSPALRRPSTSRGILKEIAGNDFIEVMLGLRRMVSASSAPASLCWPKNAYAAAKT
jgi:hypothetical protein